MLCDKARIQQPLFDIWREEKSESFDACMMRADCSFNLKHDS